jgi:hypothetical protein
MAARGQTAKSLSPPGLRHSHFSLPLLGVPREGACARIARRLPLPLARDLLCCARRRRRACRRPGGTSTNRIDITTLSSQNGCGGRAAAAALCHREYAMAQRHFVRRLGPRTRPARARGRSFLFPFLFFQESLRRRLPSISLVSLSDRDPARLHFPCICRRATSRQFFLRQREREPPASGETDKTL